MGSSINMTEFPTTDHLWRKKRTENGGWLGERSVKKESLSDLKGKISACGMSIIISASAAGLLWWIIKMSTNWA